MAQPMEHPRPDAEPDPEELAAAIGGDRAAQGSIARLYYVRMRRWALLETADPALAEDTVQDALVRWMRYAHTCRPDAPFTPWMRALVRNAARDARRSRGPVAWITSWVRPAVAPDRAVDLSRSALRALELLSRLTARQREVVELCDVQGLSAVDAAASLELSPSAVRVHLHEGRKRLKALMGPAIHDVVEE